MRSELRHDVFRGEPEAPEETLAGERKATRVLGHGPLQSRNQILSLRGSRQTEAREPIRFVAGAAGERERRPGMGRPSEQGCREDEVPHDCLVGTGSWAP